MQVSVIMMCVNCKLCICFFFQYSVSVLEYVVGATAGLGNYLYISNWMSAYVSGNTKVSLIHNKY